MNTPQEKENAATVSTVANRLAKAALSDKTCGPRPKSGTTPLRTLAEAQGAPKPKPPPHSKKDKGLVAFLAKHRPELGLRVKKVAGRAFLTGPGNTAALDGNPAADDACPGQGDRQERMNMLGMAGPGTGG